MIEVLVVIAIVELLLLKHSLESYCRCRPDLRGLCHQLTATADTTKIIRATAPTTINQVDSVGLDFSCLVAAQRSNAVSATRAVGRHIAAKFAIIISGLPRAQKCSAIT